MRILLLPKEFPSEQRANAGIFILRQAEALLARGHEVEVVRIVPYAPPIGQRWNAYRSMPPVEYVSGIPVRTIRAFFPPQMLAMEYLPLQVHRAMQREIERFRPDVINASFLIPSGQIAVRHAVPAVVTAHGSDAYSWPKRRAGLLHAAREAIVKATRVTAVSDYIRRCVQDIAQRPVDVIWNGADERFFYPRDRAEARIDFNLSPDRPVIVFAGNVLRAKGVYELVDAAATLCDLRPIVVIAGAGEDQTPLSARAGELRVDLRMLGRLEPERVGALFGAADVVVLPSYGEGLPNVVCEAMLAQQAVVATNVGGIPEIVDDERTGLLVKPADPQNLATALRRVLEDDALRERLARAAREFAVEHLTWSVSAQGYERVFRQAIGAG